MPTKWRVTPAFWITVAVWGGVFGLLSARVPASRWSVLPSGAHLLASSLAGSPVAAGCVWALALATALGLHEAGHAAAAHRMGATDVRVTLGGIHGRTAYCLEDEWSWRRAVVIVGGALAPALLLPLALVPHLQAFALIGGDLVVINLLPVPINDGGHLVDLTIHRLFGDRTPPRAAMWLDLAFLTAGFLMGTALNFGWLVVVMAPVLVLGASVIVLVPTTGTAGELMPASAPDRRP